MFKIIFTLMMIVPQVFAADKVAESREDQILKKLSDSKKQITKNMTPEQKAKAVQSILKEIIAKPEKEEGPSYVQTTIEVSYKNITSAEAYKSFCKTYKSQKYPAPLKEDLQSFNAHLCQ